MKKTKKELEGELKELKKLCKDHGLLKEITKMDEVEALESKATDECIKIVKNCERQTGRDLVLCPVHTDDFITRNEIMKIIEKVRGHRQGIPTLRNVIEDMVNLVQESPDYNFTSLDSFRSWVSNTITKYW